MELVEEVIEISVGVIIKELRKKKGLTQAELAKLLGLAPTAVSAWERNANRPMMDKLSIMAKLFDVPISTFYEDMKKPTNIIEVSQETVRIPVLGPIACGDPILAEENVEEYRTELAEGLPSGNLFFLIAKGDSMSPTIPDGSLVMFREQHDVENGEIAAVMLNGNEEATLKRVKKQGEMIVLMPDNNAHDPIFVTKENPAQIIGKAMEIRTLL